MSTPPRLLLLVVLLTAALAPARADDSKKIRALIVDRQNNHDGRHTSPYLKALLEATGRFSAEITSNHSPAEKPLVDTVPFPPDLSKYDVLLSNYNGGGWPKEMNKQIEELVGAGKLGLVIVHAANNAFGKWPEYYQMIGMGWQSKDFGDRLQFDDQG